MFENEDDENNDMTENDENKDMIENSKVIRKLFNMMETFAERLVNIENIV